MERFDKVRYKRLIWTKYYDLPSKLNDKVKKLLSFRNYELNIISNKLWKCDKIVAI